MSHWYAEGPQLLAASIQVHIIWWRLITSLSIIVGGIAVAIYLEVRGRDSSKTKK
jgi:hypothetical protein